MSQPKQEPKYRFFISYRHNKDEKIAELIEDILKKEGHDPFRDKTGIKSGASISDQIMTAISRAHFLILVIVNDSVWGSPWVQQEVGFALASNVPVIPITIGISVKPIGLIENVAPIAVDLLKVLNALNDPRIRLTEQDQDWQATVDNLPELFYKTIWDEIQKSLENALNQDWEDILRKAKVVGRAVFNYVHTAGMRPTLISKQAAAIHKNYGKVIFRQQSSLSSFSLPLPGSDSEKFWEDIPKDKYNWFFTKERENVEAVTGKCYLIIDPEYFPLNYDKNVQIAKLLTLRDYLASAGNNVEVVRKAFTPAQALTIMSNHWALQSAAVGPSDTVRSALHTWHAPTVDEYCKAFDKEFEGLKIIQEKDWMRAGLDSRSYAIVRIDCALDRLDPKGTGCQPILRVP